MSSSTGWLQPLSDDGRVIKTECKTRLPESVQVALAMAASASSRAAALAPTSVVASTTSLFTSTGHFASLFDHFTTASSAHTADLASWSPQSSRRKHCPAVRTAASTHP